MKRLCACWEKVLQYQNVGQFVLERTSLFCSLASTSDLLTLQFLKEPFERCKMTLDLIMRGRGGTGINNPSLIPPVPDGCEGPHINNQALMCLHFLLWKNGGRLNKRPRGLIGGQAEADSS